jgi:AcrR family transcriptional regulator
MARSRLQQERSRKTRRAIIDAAGILWGERGFDNVSVDEICALASVAKGSFYFYFPRKEHLLVMLVFGAFMPRQDDVRRLCDSDLSTADALADVVSGIAGRVSKLHKPLVLRAVEESFQLYREVAKVEGGNLFLRTYYELIFARGMERGELRPEWDVDILAGMMGWGTLQEIFMWAGGQAPHARLEPNLRERAELVVNGAATPRRDAPGKERRRSKRRLAVADQAPVGAPSAISPAVLRSS